MSLSDIDLNLNFVQNGGDSCSSIQLQARLRQHGIHMPANVLFAAKSLNCLAKEGNRITHSEYTETSAQPSLRPLRRKLSAGVLSSLKRRDKSAVILSTFSTEPRGTIYTKYRMTDMQSSLLRSTQLDSSRNIISYVETHRPENIPALKGAWMAVLKLEEIFSMSIEMDGSNGYLYKTTQTLPAWEEVTVKTESLHQRELTNNSQDPTKMSFKVITLKRPGFPNKSTVIWRIHHAFIDAASCALVLSKVHGLLSGKPVQPGPPFTAVLSQLDSLQSGSREAAVAFWKRYNESPTPATRLVLPTPSVGEARLSGINDRILIRTDIAALKKLGMEVGVTAASIYYAALGLALSRYTDSNSVCLGAVFSGRSLPISGVEATVGPLINTLPFLIHIDPSSDIREYLRQVFASLLELGSFQWSIPVHGFTRDFTVALSVNLDKPAARLGEFSPLGPPYNTVYSDIPLSIEVDWTGQIYLNYHSNTFSKKDIEQLGDTLSHTLSSILDSDLVIKVERLLDAFLSGQQQMALARLGNWNGSLTGRGSISDDLVSMFTRTASRNAEQQAVEHCAMSLTYADLDKLSSQAASGLADLVRPGDVVCVHADGSIQWIVAIFAVLKARAVYCPFDSGLSQSARDTNFRIVNANIYLVGNIAGKSTKPASCTRCLSIEELLTDEHVPKTNGIGQQACVPTSNAYICFTSGTTGKPKAVACRHESLIAFQSDIDVRLGARPGRRIPQLMSPAFDGSIHEIFSALTYGATLVLKDVSRPFDHLKRCETVLMTPSVAQALDPDHFPNLESVYLVGEAVPQKVCDVWGRQKRLFNMYGPTEGTCGATIKSLKVNEPVTLGKPVPSTRIYILSSQQRAVPPGVVGEIYIAGIQVATGYIGQTDATDSRFIRDCINKQYANEFMYKTGDHGFWNEQGDLMFLGRGDRQIKLRGFRIDLDDLEARMTQADANCTAAAVAVIDECLVALVQPLSLDLNQFKLRLCEHLPTYMLPRHIVSTGKFPMTRIGKLDYAAVATIASTEVGAKPSLTGVGIPVEATIREMLGIQLDERLSPDSTFSELGVDSTLALLLSHRLSRSFKIRIPVRMVLGTATIGALIEEVASSSDISTTATGDVLGNCRLSPIEQEWWYKCSKHKKTSCFNVTYACELPPSIGTTRLISAWNIVLSRHDILRSRYTNYGPRGLHRTFSPGAPTAKLVQSIDIQQEVNVPFDLSSDSLVRVLVSPTTMLVVISHIICDLKTLQILLKEAADVYDGGALQQVEKTYSQTVWSEPASPSRLSLWTEYLTAMPLHSSTSIGRFETRRKTWSGSSYTYQIPASTYLATRRFALKKKVTMHQLATTAMTLALKHDSAEDWDITIGAPYLNRHSEVDMTVVGLFLEPLPIRIRYMRVTEQSLEEVESRHNANFDNQPIPVKPEPPSLLEVVQNASRDAISCAIPWNQLLTHMNILHPDFPNHPLFDVVVTFHEAGENETRFPVPGTRYLPTWSKGAKFKLMAEFTAREDSGLSLRLEYSDECITETEIKTLARMLDKALEDLAAGTDHDIMIESLQKLRRCQ
ncbi:acetyl-CoA synthetase-like protein [Xylaria bambusicola]|uniref:acetyl-CoA synthetase-like protein n=1 Tax=Xylaria bambusicola TaxID=326684 RepID=UPI002007E641|nr:acetyl-CoA synthetase-like protein [Xylaria bambusicola]KAI0508614.1 acetyl-CoA synthetase-like protein [Xylaria bambusicola]